MSELQSCEIKTYLPAIVTILLGDPMAYKMMIDETNFRYKAIENPLIVIKRYNNNNSKKIRFTKGQLKLVYADNSWAHPCLVTSSCLAEGIIINPDEFSNFNLVKNELLDICATVVKKLSQVVYKA
jgi:hypothetical protein